jgi:N-methylhydantoinase B
MQMSLRPHGVDKMTGVTNARRPYLPTMGMAGGFPGARTVLRIHRADGTLQRVATKATGIVITPEEWFEFQCSNGGGWGDPLERDAALVADEVALDRLSTEEAFEVYGVVLDARGQVDAAATMAHRKALLQDRLSRASPPRLPPGADAKTMARGEAAAPLYPGIEQRGPVAVVAASGTVLAIAPNPWTAGCAVLTEPFPAGGDLKMVLDTYLDPMTGRALHLDLRLGDEPSEFDSSPARWSAARRSTAPV